MTVILQVGKNWYNYYAPALVSTVSKVDLLYSTYNSLRAKGPQ